MSFSRIWNEQRKYHPAKRASGGNQGNDRKPVPVLVPIQVLLSSIAK